MRIKLKNIMKNILIGAILLVNYGEQSHGTDHSLAISKPHIWFNSSSKRDNNQHQKIINNSRLNKEVYKDTSHLQSAFLKLVVANNKAYGKVHQAGYSGISELYIINGGKNLFTPPYAGLNYEFIFSGDSKSFEWNIFEPRRAKMKLKKLSDSKIILQQSRTKNWPLKSNITYELIEDGIDFVFTGIPLKDIWKKHGYIGIFFASYINTPQFAGINFIGQSREGKGDTIPRWIYSLPEKHGLNANHRPVGSQWDPAFDEGFPLSLVSGFSNVEYVYPFYYGLSGENVFIMMFDNEGNDGEIRFAQSPDGAGPGNPAWDFIYFRKNYKVGGKFNFRARAVYKKFEGKEDVIKIYKSWSREKVIMLTP